MPSDSDMPRGEHTTMTRNQLKFIRKLRELTKITGLAGIYERMPEWAELVAEREALAKQWRNFANASYTDLLEHSRAAAELQRKQDELLETAYGIILLYQTTGALEREWPEIVPFVQQIK